jgi:hypothetical protein
MHRYKVRKVNLFPLAKFGCLLGGLALFLPGLLCSIASAQMVGALRTLLENWQKAVLDLGLVPVEFDFVTLLGLEAALAALTTLDDNSFLLVLLIMLLYLIVGGFLVGVTVLLLGWVYNLVAALTGGLEVELHKAPDA